LLTASIPVIAVQPAAKVRHRDQPERGEATLERVGMQARYRRGQRANSGGNADRDIQHVVDHQHRGGEEAHRLAEIFLRDRIGTATGRIGSDRLPIGDVENAQEHEYRQHDCAEMGKSGRPERDENRQRRFRPVGRGAKPVETHRRHAFVRADFALGVLPICGGAPEEEAEEG
jgi:hypothetical protein